MKVNFLKFWRKYNYTIYICIYIISIYTNIISTATIISVPAALDESIISTHVTNSSDKKLKRKRNNKNNNDNNSNNIDVKAEPDPTALSSHYLAKKLLEEKEKQKGSSFAVEFAKSRKMETDLQREQFNWNKKQTMSADVNYADDE